MDEVSDLLRDAKTSDYEKSFRDNGYDKLDQIISIVRSFPNMFNFSTTWAQKRFFAALDAYKSKVKVAPSPIESHEYQSFENDQREKPPSVLCKYQKTSSFIDRLNFC